MSTDPLFDKQTLWAIVLIAVASAFICGVAIGSYEEPKHVTETNVETQSNEIIDQPVERASQDQTRDTGAPYYHRVTRDGATEPPVNEQYQVAGCILTLVDDVHVIPQRITANNSLVIPPQTCNQWFNQLADMINEGLIDWTDLLIFTK